MIDAYRIGVSIALTNGVSAVLAVIQKDVLGLKKAVDFTTGSLNRMKVAAAGFAGVAIGGAMLAGLWELSKSGEKYLHQLEMMKLAGFNVAEQQQAIIAANRVASSVLTTTPTENLQAIRELRAALNSAGASPQVATEEAIKYLAVVQQAQAVMQTTAGGRAAAANGGVYQMVKALEEIRATQNPERFQSLLSGMVQASEAFGGKITAQDWYQTLKYTRMAGQFYSDDFIAHYLPTLMQEMKSGAGSGAGGGPGAPLASLFQAVVGNVFSRSALDLGEKLGLIDPTKIHPDKHGRITKDPGAWFGADLAATNPALWVQQFLMPHLAKQMGGHMLDVGANGQYVHVKEMAGILATLFGNRTAQQMIGLLLNVQKMEGDKKLVTAAMNLGAAYDEIIRMDPPTVRRAVEEQWSRVTTDLGKAISPATTYFMFRLAQGLSYLAEVIERHPVITEWVLKVVAAIAALLVVVGTVAIGAAAIAALGSGALWAGAIAGVVAFFTALDGILLSHVDWHAASEWVQGVWRALTGFAGRFMSIGRRMTGDLIVSARAWITEIIASLKQDILEVCIALTSALKSVVDTIRSWVQSIGSAISGLFKGLGQTVAPGAPVFGGTAYHPPANTNRMHIENVLYLDGEVVHRSVTKRMARDSARAPRAANIPDGRLNLIYAT